MLSVRHHSVFVGNALSVFLLFLGIPLARSLLVSVRKASKRLRHGHRCVITARVGSLAHGYSPEGEE